MTTGDKSSKSPEKHQKTQQRTKQQDEPKVTNKDQEEAQNTETEKAKATASDEVRGAAEPPVGPKPDGDKNGVQRILQIVMIVVGVPISIYLMLQQYLTRDEPPDV